MFSRFRYRAPSKRVLEKLKVKRSLRNVSLCSHCQCRFDNCLCTKTQHVWDSVKKQCRICGERTMNGVEFKVNGTGPSDSPFIRFLIRLFPFNRWVDDISNDHDIAYFEGYTKEHKKAADNDMLLATTKKVRETWFLWPTMFWVKRAELNFIAVRDGGDSSFNWSGCISEKNIKKETDK